jgi:hypothetical protein
LVRTGPGVEPTAEEETVKGSKRPLSAVVEAREEPAR